MTSYILPGQQAPYSQEAEEAVLGAVMTNPDAFLGVASFLNAEDFYILRHSYIWEALARISERNEKADYVTVQEELRQTSRLNDIGGAAYLLQLINNTPTSVHAEVYGKLVERAAIRRRLMTAADEIKALALEEDMAIEKVTSEAESRLFHVTERNLRRDLVAMREALSDYFERIEHLMQHPDEPMGLPTGFRDVDELLGGLQRSDLLIFAGRPGMGKCVTGDTLISTEHGFVPIEDLKPEGVTGIPDEDGGVFYPLQICVQTPDGMRKTAYFYDSGVKPTRRIQTRAGYALTGTHTHPVLTLAATGEKVWKPLAEIQPGDYIAVQRHEALWGNVTQFPKFEFSFYHSNVTLKPNLPTKMTPELAYVLGLLAGDGNLTRKNYVGFSSSDPNLISAFYDWIASIGLKARYRAGYDHIVGSIVLNTWLKHIGLSGYAYEKEVPYSVLQAPKECVIAFLQGLFDTDGHAEVQRGYIQFVSSSEVLARQVHLLLLQLGIIAKLTFKANDHRGSWGIRITGEAARKFYATIGFRLERKQARQHLLPETANANLDVVLYLPRRLSSLPKHVNYHRYFLGRRSPSYLQLHKIAVYAPEVTPLLEPEFYWDEVVSVEDAGLQHCYDLSVPEGNAFVSNGIVSHNTSFLLSVALNAAKLGARIAIFTMEMGSEQIVQRFVSMETGINTQKLRTGQLNQQEWSRFVQATGRLANLRVFIDDTPAMTPLQMRTKCRRLMHEYGLDLVIVDYMQLMSSGGGYENNRVQEISFISRSLKELARELNVPVFSAAQLSRAVEQRQDKRPMLSDLRESGCLAGDTLVYLPETGRRVPIRELSGQVGFKVLSLNTETWKQEAAIVSHAFCTGVKPVFKLVTKLGRTIRATGNHKFLTINGWKRLDELTGADVIALPAVQQHGITARQMQAELGNQYCGTGLYKQNISRERAVKLADVVKSDDLHSLSSSDVYWDAIVSIEPDGETDVYDLTVPSWSNFVANNIIVHNSIEQDADIVAFLYRDAVYNEAAENPNRADIIIAKHRNGPTGTISLHFEKSLTKFADARTQTIDLSNL
jgi:replicative DNA helicase